MNPLLAARIRDFNTTVFAEFSELALQHGAVNLGQGFPDFEGPTEIKERALQAIRDGENQYARSSGMPPLHEAIAEHAARFYCQMVDPSTQITVTAGATEALFDATLGVVDPGDEVVLFEPYYDSYAANVTLAGGVARYVLLQPPDAGHPTWWFDAAELEAAFSERTKLIIVNTPHNPTGKVFTRDELTLIARLCEQHDVLALSDEVYEHIVFAPAKHVRLATLPGMEQRTLTLSSGGKSFGFTGWKVGWAITPPALRPAVLSTHQFVTFATAPPFQLAIAAALRLPDSYFTELTRMYQAKRDNLVDALAAAHLQPISPEGTYFVMARTHQSDDFAFCRSLTQNTGVAAIPPSAFYSEPHRSHGRGLARFAFCKRDETLAAARARLVKR